MSFNYGREEKKWRLWKETEEKQLRGLGVSEDTIEQLRTHDWAVINVNIKMYIFDHLRMYIFAIPPLDRYIFSIDKIFQ